MKRYFGLAALACLPWCHGQAHHTQMAPAVHSLDGPFASEGTPVAGDRDGDGCIEPWVRVDADPRPNDDDYCMWVRP